MSTQVSIDLITRLPSGEIALTLVEQGPWEEQSTKMELTRLQDRLFDCLDVVRGGALYERFPEAKTAKAIVIRLHCYNTPAVECRSLFAAFEAHVRSSVPSDDKHAERDIEFEFQASELNPTS